MMKDSLNKQIIDRIGYREDGKIYWDKTDHGWMQEYTDLGCM